MEDKSVFLFDLDGVITSTDSYHFKAWREMASRIDIELSSEFESKLKGVSRRESLKTILDHYNKEISDELFDSLLIYKNGYYLELLRQLDKDSVFDNVFALLSEINRSGNKAILVSASMNAPFILDKLKLDKFFDMMVDASLISKSKPDPEIFLKALEMSGHDKIDCVVIEDSQSGIIAANEAGIDVIAYEPNGDSLVDYTIKVKNHSEILQYIRR